jgi:putative ABC transport system substrate-binding protein
MLRKSARPGNGEKLSFSGWLAAFVLVLMLGCSFPGPVLAGEPTAPGGRAPRRVLVLAYARPFLKAADGLKAGLRQLGLKPHREVVFTVHELNRDLARIGQLLPEKMGSPEKNWDLIYTITTPVTLAVKKIVEERGLQIPVVFVVVADPEGSGVVADLRRPGGWFTGISHSSLELLPQRLLLFREAFPKMRRLLVFFNPDEEISRRSYDSPLLHRAARDCGVDLVACRVRNGDELERQCARLRSRPGSVDGIFMLPDPFSVAHYGSLLKLSRGLKLPLMVIDNMLLQQGGVLGYSPDFYDVGSQSATLVKHVLAGIPPGEIPVQNADRVKLVVSLREARALGLRPSPRILLRADEVLR